MDHPKNAAAPPDGASPVPTRSIRRFIVPTMLCVSSLFMAVAWIGHLRFEDLPFLKALGLCWLLVLPEYYLNVKAIRMGYAFYSGAQMAAFRLCSGVVFVALTARFVLGEELGSRQLAGFAIMFIAILLVAYPGSERDANVEGVAR